MGLILCEDKNIKTPLYVDELGVHVFSIEELSYVIYEYPLIAIDNFVNDRLINFIQDELGLVITVLKMDRSRILSDNDDEILLSILSCSDYYSSAEIERYKKVLEKLHELPSYELIKQKGDQLFKLRKYGSAIRKYELAINNSIEKKAPIMFQASVFENIGSAYANLFEYDKAFNYFMEAYAISKSKDILKKIYFLSEMEDVIENKEKYLAVLPNGTDINWSIEFETIKSRAKDAESVIAIEEIDKKDSIKKLKLLNTELIEKQKLYRQMI